MFADVLARSRQRERRSTLIARRLRRAASRSSAGEHVVVADRRPAEKGQSQAALAGLARAAALGYERALLVPGDCPLLDPAELDALVREAAEPGRRDRSRPPRHGTNALLLDPRGPFEPQFGPGSLERHTEQARASGACDCTRRRRCRRSALDVDTPRRPRPSCVRRSRRRTGARRAHARGAEPDRAAASTRRQLERRPVRRGRSPACRRCGPATTSPQLIADAARAAGVAIGDGDVLVIAQKVVSKAEAGCATCGEVEPSAQARELGAKLDKDPRLVQVVLDESTEVLRAERGVLIMRTRHGLVCANAGVDQSNVPGEDVVSPAARRPGRARPGSCARRWRAPRRPARGRDLRQLRPRLAAGPGGRRDRLRRAGAARRPARRARRGGPRADRRDRRGRRPGRLGRRARATQGGPRGGRGRARPGALRDRRRRPRRRGDHAPGGGGPVHARAPAPRRRAARPPSAARSASFGVLERELLDLVCTGHLRRQLQELVAVGARQVRDAAHTRSPHSSS